MATLFAGPLTSAPDLVAYEFRFQINGTSDPDNIFPSNSGISDITRTSAGLFAITFAEKHPALVGVTGSVLEATPAHDLIVKTGVGAYSATTGILSVTVVGADGSTAAEDPADNDWVYVRVVFCRKTVSAVTASI